MSIRAQSRMPLRPDTIREVDGSNPSARSQWSLLLFTNSDGSEAVLYVYRDRKFFRSAIGRVETLEQFARSNYPDTPVDKTILSGWFEFAPPEIA